jgi:DNA-binding PadR family transcriptional regulator
LFVNRNAFLDHSLELSYYAEHMAGREHLGEFEQIVLLAILRLRDEAYGVPIRREIEKRTKRSLTVGALYRTLDRLEEKSLVTSWFGDPTEERGGRSRRYFKVQPPGIRALRESREALAAMWKGLDIKAIHGS